MNNSWKTYLGHVLCAEDVAERIGAWRVTGPKRIQILGQLGISWFDFESLIVML